MENIKSIEETILIYTHAWNETERAAIREKIDQCWSAKGTFTDKVTDTITGRDAITDLIIGSYGQMGPRTFMVLAEPVTHQRKRPLPLAGDPSRRLPGRGHGLF